MALTPTVKVLTRFGPEWDEAVERCSLHDVFHHSTYHQAMAGDAAPVLLFGAADNRPPWAFPLLLRPISEAVVNAEGLDAFGVYGYSGIAWSPEFLAEYAWDRVWKDIRTVLLDLGVVSVFTRWNPFDDATWSLPMGAELRPLGQTAVMDLSVDGEDYWNSLKKGHRYDVRRALRDGLEVDAVDDHAFFSEFYELYLETMARVGADTSYDFGAERVALLGAAGEFHLVTVRARSQGRIMATSLFLIHPPYAHYFLSGSTSESAFGSRPSKLLIHSARDYVRRLGAKYLHLGGGVGGRADDLFNFKSGFTPHRLQFRALRWVLDEDEYASLQRAQGIGSTDWFPAYRHRKPS